MVKSASSRPKATYDLHAAGTGTNVSDLCVVDLRAVELKKRIFSRFELALAKLQQGNSNLLLVGLFLLFVALVVSRLWHPEEQFPIQAPSCPHIGDLDSTIRMHEPLSYGSDSRCRITLDR